jgi:hypothetical protein
MATGFAIGQLVGALARGPLTAADALTGHNTVVSNNLTKRIIPYANIILGYHW